MLTKSSQVLSPSIKPYPQAVSLRLLSNKEARVQIAGIPLRYSLDYGNLKSRILPLQATSLDLVTPQVRTPSLQGTPRLRCPIGQGSPKQDIF